MTLVFLNDGKSHDQVQDGPHSFHGDNGYEKHWADAHKIRLPVGQKWSLDLSGSAMVAAIPRWVKVWIDGKMVLAPIPPHGTYYLHAHIKKKNAQGEFKTVKTGNNDTIFKEEYRDKLVLSETTEVYLIHICNNKFDLDNYQVDVKGTITNEEPNPDEKAKVSLTL